MKTSVQFTSRLFIPFLPDDSQVNTKVYGAELTYWLSRELAHKNIITSYPEYEDWGWFIEFLAAENEYWLCCANNNEEGTQWQCFLRPKTKGFWKRSKAPIEGAAPLLEAVQQILTETPGISDIVWSNDHLL